MFSRKSKKPKEQQFPKYLREKEAMYMQRKAPEETRVEESNSASVIDRIIQLHQMYILRVCI